MSGIPIYTNAAISQATAADDTIHKTEPQQVQATTTATPTLTYPAAQPGARPAAPTGSTQQYTPFQATPGPPPPQAGAFPTPSNLSSLPPPPKVGEKYNPPPQQTQTAAPSYYPPQMGIPPPTAGSHPPPTSTTNAPSSSYPVGLPDIDGGRRSLEHPPGYQQNTHAADLNPDQRRAHESSAHTSNLGLPTSSQNRSSFEEESLWDTAKNWAQQAGEKLSAAEAEVWKKINK